MSKQFDSRDCFQFWMQLGKKFFQNCAEANPKISCAYSTRCLLQDPNKYDPCWATAGPSFVKQVATIFEMIRSFLNDTSNQDQLVATENPPAWVSSLFNLSKPSTTNSHWAGGYKWFQVYAPFMMNI